MCLITTEVNTTLSPRTLDHYEGLGYIIPRRTDKKGRLKYAKDTQIRVKVDDLLPTSQVMVCVKCDNCNAIMNISWHTYQRCVQVDGKYYCKRCVFKLYASEKSRLTQLKNSYSFAEYNIKIIGNDFLEKYWDWDKNTYSPYEISFKSEKDVWIKCQEKTYHGSYVIPCKHFSDGVRCGYCSSNSEKVHPLDSIGAIKPYLIEEWHPDNNKTPFEYLPNSMKIVKWICKECGNEWCAKISYRNEGCGCPECNISKGEKNIKDFLELHQFIKITDYNFNNLNANDIQHNKYYTSQVTFEGLIGIGGGLLSYDFYLPQYNLLIEYQGEFHDGSSGEYSQKNLKRQQEHDKRKREYAENHNITLREIWYYDFNNIEQILYKELLLEE